MCLYFEKEILALRKEDIALIKQLTERSNATGEDARVYERMLNSSANWEMPNTGKPDFSAFAEKLNDRKPTYLRKWMVAASFTALMLIGCWLYYFVDLNSFHAPMAQMKTVWLPDSSKVILNADAQLSYSKRSWKKHVRKVQLSGIAYFEVRKGSRFEVETDHGEVTVLGTSFNVKALADDFIVECITGKVAVNRTAEINQSVILTPGFKVESSASASTLKAQAFDTKRAKEWVSGVFNFDNQPLANVLAEIERQFDVEVHYEDGKQRFYTGTFSNDDLDKALSAVLRPMGLSYEVDREEARIRIM